LALSRQEPGACHLGGACAANPAGLRQRALECAECRRRFTELPLETAESREHRRTAWPGLTREPQGLEHDANFRDLAFATRLEGVVDEKIREAGIGNDRA